MTAPSTLCPSCGEEVPFGRRTCEACGANVTTAAAPHESPTDEGADEAGGPADSAARPGAEPAPTDDAGWDLANAPAPIAPGIADEPSIAAAAAPVGPATAPEATPVQWPEPDPAPVQWPEPEATDLSAAEAQAPSAPEPTPVEPAAPFIPPVLREWNPGTPQPETGFAAELAVAEAEPAGLAGSWLPPSATPPGALPEAPSMQYRPAEPASAALAAPPDGPPPGADEAPPGAMPATLAAMLNRTSTGTPRWPGADRSPVEPPSQTSATTGATMAPPSRMPDLGPAGAYAAPAVAAPPPAQRSLEPGKAPLFADLPFDAPNTLPGWLVAGGGAIATVSFLLPWVAVIDSYFTAWGLGSIANLPAFLVVFGTTALAILPSRLADWLRHGILGLAVGSFILGLTWNRLVGATGGQIGVILEGTGALLLLIGGILALVRDRDAGDGPGERR